MLPTRRGGLARGGNWWDRVPRSVVYVLGGLLVLIPVFLLFGSSKVQVCCGNGNVDLSEIMAVSVQLARAAGDEIVRIRDSKDLGEESKGSTLEGVNDPLTAADMTAHRVLVSHLHGLWPQVTVVSEEHDTKSLPAPWLRLNPDSLRDRLSKYEVESDRVRVWVDPLDATKEFTESLDEEKEKEEGLSGFVTVLACVVLDGEPVGGVIHFPFKGTTLWALKDYGSSFEPAPAPPAGDDKISVIISRSHAGDIRASQDAMNIGTVTPAGGAGYKIAEVLEGNQDVYLHKTLIKKWDLCAGDALLRASGGKLTDWGGKPLDYSDGEHPKVYGGVAASLHKHDQAMKAVSIFNYEDILKANGAPQ